MFYDAALVFNRDTRRCDLALGEDGDLVIDTTPITPTLLSIGLDRRAAPDDPLPSGRTVFTTDAPFGERRGAVGDALDRAGDLTGSKIWLLDRAKETEATRLLFEMWLRDSLAWARVETGAGAEIEVTWVRPSVLGYRVLVADASITQSRSFA